ncbi:hypothetical protein [Corynebacterium pacaense]|uniref:Rv2732c family membrane protein n=1 Tax=Corynebacterium pacaense TaxID=1816684 RepID=UPI0009BB56A9|nr:hypothetical protein [Corynebacterium pacaense]
MSDKKLSGRELAELEKEAAKTLDLGSRKWYLIAGVALFLLALVLPHIRGVMGWQILFLTDTASNAGIRLAEYVFYWLGTIGVVAFSLGTVVFRKTWMSYIAWIFSCVTLVYAVFATWMRQTSTGTDVTVINIGMLVAIIAAVCAVWGLSGVILARSDRQQEVAQLRAANDDLDTVAEAQRELLKSQQHDSGDNPLLVDDRRARAAQRHQPEPPSKEEGEN